MVGDRGRRVRALVGQWCTEFDTVFTPQYDDRQRRWSLRWRGDPSPDVVRQRWPQEWGELEVWRHLSVRSHAVGAVAAALGGAMTATRRDCRDLMEKVTVGPDPVGREPARTVALGDAVLAGVGVRVNEEQVWDAVRTRGVSWVLVEPGRATVDTPAELVMTPCEVLSARYAGDEDVRAWRWELTPLPARAAVEAAHGDPDADREVRLAVLGQLRVLRREHERFEDEALQRAHDQGASWTAIGAALGTTRQSAHERGRRRAEGTPTRLSNQP